MNNDTQSLQIMRKLTDQYNYKDKQYSVIVYELWNKYQKEYESNNNLNGAVFEEIIGFILSLANCTPFYMQAKVAYVPNVNYDFICYDDKLGPISLSAKTSLRERWKQADLEAVALKYVHRNAKSYLITLDTDALKTRLDKVGDCMGLNDFILATSSQFDHLIHELKKRKFKKAGKVQIISSNTIIDNTNYKNRYGC